jgi:hypothetical protein
MVSKNTSGYYKLMKRKDGRKCIDKYSALETCRLPVYAVILLHGTPTVAVLHGIDLQTETHITGSKVQRNHHFKVFIVISWP